MVKGDKEVALKDACGRMWRKLKLVSDLPCGLWANAKKCDTDKPMKVFENMPTIPWRT
jgi:hypothetical protein